MPHSPFVEDERLLLCLWHPLPPDMQHAYPALGAPRTTGQEQLACPAANGWGYRLGAACRVVNPRKRDGDLPAIRLDCHGFALAVPAPSVTRVSIHPSGVTHAINRWLVPAFGDVRVSDVDESRVRRLLADL